MNAISKTESVAESFDEGEFGFKRLVEKYYQQAYSIAYFYTANREAALDISQDAFLRIYRHLKDYDKSRPFSAWLYAIVKNLSFNYLKRKRKRWITFSDFFTGKNRQEPQDESLFLENKEVKQDVWKAIRKLDERQREIILLRDFEEYSYREISEMLGIPEGTVMSRLFHARKKLAKLLKEMNYV